MSALDYKLGYTIEALKSIVGHSMRQEQANAPSAEELCAVSNELVERAEREGLSTALGILLAAVSVLERVQLDVSLKDIHRAKD